jgi:hypothetical protein
MALRTSHKKPKSDTFLQQSKSLRLEDGMTPPPPPLSGAYMGSRTPHADAAAVTVFATCRCRFCRF